MANNLTPFYDDGDHLPCVTTAAVVGKTFVDISGSRDSGPGLAADGTTYGNYKVQTAAAAGLILGVAEFDAVLGAQVTVARGPHVGVIPVTAGAAIAAGQEVEVGAGGLAVPHNAGIAVGRCLTAAANGADAEIILYR